MTLALAHGHAPPAFNGLYYATIATVIPVLFLAIAVQGTIYQDLIKAAARSAASSRAQGRYPHNAVALMSLCGLVVIYGEAGELFAITALARSIDGFAQQWITDPGALVLTIIAAAGPARVFVKAAAAVATKDGTVTWSNKPKTAQSVPGRPFAERAEQAAEAHQPACRRAHGHAQRPSSPRRPKWAKRTPV